MVFIPTLGFVTLAMPASMLLSASWTMSRFVSPVLVIVVPYKIEPHASIPWVVSF